MLSICIPIYNFDVNELIEALEKQIKTIEIHVEIICIDDASSNEYVGLNKKCSNHQYILLNKNIGRAKIRNHFLQYTSSENLLFLDCDSKIISTNFVQNYIQFIETSFKNVAYGGRVYDAIKPSSDRILSWKYGSTIESKSAIEREKFPSINFQTNNFLIKKSTLSSTPFDERLLEYGHEDTLFGYQLKKQSVEIQHIENPVMNGDVETNKKFIEKSEKALKNLHRILAYTNYDKLLIKDVKILRFVYGFKPSFLLNIVQAIFFIFKPFIKFILIKGFANMYLLNFYKLGYYLQYSKK